MLIISNSGRNAVPIEMAIEAKRRGLYTIAISTSNYKEEPSRHSSEKKLYEIADIAIDNCSLIGDAIVEVEKGIYMGPTSTIVGSALVQSLMIQLVYELQQLGIVPPIIQSSNVDKAGVEEKNKKLMDHYSKRINF